MLRSHGLTAPISTMLDPQAWRDYYGFAIRPSSPAGTSGSAVQRYSSLCRAGLSPDVSATAQAVADILTDDAIRYHLRVAASEAQVRLGIPLDLTVCKATPIDEGLVQGIDYDVEVSRKPFTTAAARNYYEIQLPGPVISIERIRAFYFAQLIWEFSGADIAGARSSVRLIWQNTGGANIMPLHLSTALFTAATNGAPGNYGIWHLLGGLAASPLPDVWAIDYTRGPIDQETGLPAHIPLVLMDWIMSAAGIKLLSMEGIARSKGLSSTSVSFDGLSRSVGLQASAIYGLNSALEEVMRKNMERIDLKALRRYMRGVRVLPYGY